MKRLERIRARGKEPGWTAITVKLVKHYSRVRKYKKGDLKDKKENGQDLV